MPKLFWKKIVVAILLAAGKGTRFGEDKLAYRIGTKPVLEYSLERLSESQSVDKIVIVTSTKSAPLCRKLAKDFSKVVKVEPGGDSRFASSTIGFAATQALGADIVLWHNGCNPGVTVAEIDAVIAATKAHGAAGVARQVTSTLRHQQGGIIDRNGLYAMETPQAIRTEIVVAGLDKIDGEPTDDLQIAEAAGYKPQLLPASTSNYKLTTPADAEFLENIMQARTQTRIGLGNDSHRFSQNGTLILGGMEIQTAPKLEGNSDGDAVLHALTNAFSSALGGHSLSNFSDELCKQGITDSAKYLAVVLQKLTDRGGGIQNIAISIEAAKPKLEALLPQMSATIATICNILPDQVGITVTSGEGLTAVGRGEGIAVTATVSVLLPITE